MPDKRKVMNMNIKNVKKDGPTIKKITKKDGSTVYRSNIYLGIDVITGKSVRTSITAKTQKAVKLKTSKAITDFQNNGSTRLAKVTCKTFSELILSWWDNHKLSLKNNTIANNSVWINSYIIPTFGAYSVNKITTAIIQNQMNIWANNANSSKSNTTGATKAYPMLLNIITRTFQYGISIGVIHSNPARDVILPKIKRQENKKIKYFDNDQLKTWYVFLDSLPNTERNNLLVTLCKLLLSTGMRVSEALALEWTDIDFDNQVISVTKTLDNVSNLEQTPKTRSSVRKIDIDNSTILMLKQYRNRQRMVFSNSNIKLNGIVFTNGFKPYLFRTNLLRKLKKYFIRAELPDIGFHGFRHTHASLLLNAGVDYKELQHRLGHAQLSMTMDTYSHLSPKNAKAVVDIFDKAIQNL